MDLSFTPQEGAALYGLLADDTSDVILRTDAGGFIRHASAAIASLGLPPSDELFGRHLVDLVQPGHARALRAKHRLVSAGAEDPSWTEFPARCADGGEHWFEIRMRAVKGEDEACGVLSVMRSIEERKAFERRLFVATMTDPLTGLSNRAACTAMLRHLIDDAEPGCLAIFDIDHFKAINLTYGHSVGDDVLIAFASFLKASLREKDIISRIGGESLGVILSGADPAQAAALCRRIVASIAELGGQGGPAIPITASAGVARIGTSVDDTIRRAEMALALAKAKGRNRLELEAA